MLVINILYWRNPQTTGAIFGFGLLFLFAVSLNPFIHTLVLLLLASMVVSLLYCVGMVLWNSFYNRPIENPFRYYYCTVSHTMKDPFLFDRAMLKKDSIVSKENVRCLFFIIFMVVIIDISIKSRGRECVLLYRAI